MSTHSPRGAAGRVISEWRSAAVGLAGQLVMLPLLGMGLAGALQLSPELALGVVIVTACPGGAPSNIFTFLAGGNVALSVTLTALSSTATLLSVPFWVNIGIRAFASDGEVVRLPILPTMGQLFALSLVPLSIGMALRSRNPEFAARLKPHLRRAAAILFAVALSVIVGSQWQNVVEDLAVAAPSALALVILALGIAYAMARLSNRDDRDAFTISIEVGLQNGALATLVVTNLLQRPELIVFPGCYALVAFLPVSIWTWIHRWRGLQPSV